MSTTIIEAKKNLYKKLEKVNASPTFESWHFYLDGALIALKELLRVSHNKPKYRKYKEPLYFAKSVAWRLASGEKVSERQILQAQGVPINLRNVIYQDLIKL